MSRRSDTLVRRWTGRSARPTDKRYRRRQSPCRRCEVTEKDEGYSASASVSTSALSGAATGASIESGPDSDWLSFHHVNPHPASVTVIPTTRSCSRRFMVTVLLGSRALFTDDINSPPSRDFSSRLVHPVGWRGRWSFHNASLVEHKIDFRRPCPSTRQRYALTHC